MLADPFGVNDVRPAEFIIGVLFNDADGVEDREEQISWGTEGTLKNEFELFVLSAKGPRFMSTGFPWIWPIWNDANVGLRTGKAWNGSGG